MCGVRHRPIDRRMSHRVMTSCSGRASRCRRGQGHRLRFASVRGAWIRTRSARGVGRIAWVLHHIDGGIVLLFCTHGMNLGRTEFCLGRRGDQENRLTCPVAPYGSGKLARRSMVLQWRPLVPIWQPIVSLPWRSAAMVVARQAEEVSQQTWLSPPGRAAPL
jgi:hypothetical protein